MRSIAFTRPTVIAAIELLEKHTQAKFNQMILRLRLEDDIPSETSLSVAKKCDLLGRLVVKQPDACIDTLEGPMTLNEAVVREAIRLVPEFSENTLHISFLRGLARDGYVLHRECYNSEPNLRAALPEQIKLPQTADEVHSLLKDFGFLTSLGHLNQAIDAHTRGDWAAANSQLRTFIESLFDHIAHNIRPKEAGEMSSSENRRALLAKVGFLASDRNEWHANGKSYIHGLFKMLHTDGSHPGLSDEDHCTFRLHVVIVTARTFLRRLSFNS
ncbi:hypothetical protein PsAD13_01471 [Pseudovibrio sp. Ad13]|uniref:hypothetical protein n=1 Tax=Pseudovibrio sp. Ad13 TaxID=989396 RepID=UPI0007AED87C|nr:hypothetical protein [Pseudovibrio sp. Ad13]KZK84937.1 hypothetical protein PsAD13_01471 [Pseudovibrio sp. Ad13]